MSRKTKIAEVRLQVHRPLGPSSNAVRVGPYVFVPVPSGTRGTGQILMKFSRPMSPGPSGGVNPHFEGQLVARVLSILFGISVSVEGVRYMDLDLPDSRCPDHFRGGPLHDDEPVELAAAVRPLGGVLRRPEDLVRQIARSGRAYSLATVYIPTDPTFAFFLLSTAIECLSNLPAVIPTSVIHGDKKCERFCHFIRTNLPASDRGPDEADEALFTRLLKTVYYDHRSGFVHGGKEVSTVSLMADDLGSSYFKHEVDGKEVKTPGLRWFERVVQGSLSGFVRAFPRTGAKQDGDVFHRLAMERSVIKIKAARDIAAGEAVRATDIEYR